MKVSRRPLARSGPRAYAAPTTAAGAAGAGGAGGAGGKVNPYSPAKGHPYRHGVVATRPAVTALMRANAQVLTGSTEPAPTYDTDLAFLDAHLDR